MSTIVTTEVTIYLRVVKSLSFAEKETKYVFLYIYLFISSVHTHITKRAKTVQN